MSKSVLIVDTPKNCDECRFCKHEYPYPYCRITIKSINDLNTIQDWCPLSLIPERKILRQYADNTALNMESIMAYQYAQGWNDCIYELMEEKK